jgi:hypothetical protein
MVFDTFQQTDKLSLKCIAYFCNFAFETGPEITHFNWHVTVVRKRVRHVRDVTRYIVQPTDIQYTGTCLWRFVDWIKQEMSAVFGFMLGHSKGKKKKYRCCDNWSGREQNGITHVCDCGDVIVSTDSSLICLMTYWSASIAILLRGSI